MRNLTERPVDFSYGFNMNCPECGAVVGITADVYYREQECARIKCPRCHWVIQYGPTMMTLRDADDSVLDDQAAVDSAWYHTTACGDWPSGSRPAWPTDVDNPGTTPESREHIRERHEDKALHLGTYEAAIECMLRKMCDENLAGSQFWLFRIAVHPEIDIEPGYRDENTEDASQMTQAELQGWAAVRYLNVQESPGSISLAVRPRGVQETQRVRLPLQAPEAAAPPPLMRMIAQIRDRIAHIEATRQDKPDATVRARHRWEAAMLRMQGAPEVITPTRDPTPEQYALEEEIGEMIARRYLPEVSLPVRERFCDALSHWRNEQDPIPGDVAHIVRFAAMARVLTHPYVVLRALDEVGG